MFRIKRQLPLTGSICSEDLFYYSGFAYHSREPVFCHVVNMNANRSNPSHKSCYMPVKSNLLEFLLGGGAEGMFLGAVQSWEGNVCLTSPK